MMLDDELGRLSREVRSVARWLACVARRPDVVSLNGVKLEIGPWATAPIRKAVYQGWYEKKEREVLGLSLRADDIVLELGCGSGYITTFAARIAREVWAFEGHPDMVEVARQTVARNGVAAKIEHAIVEGDATETAVRFYVEPEFTESSLRPSSSGRSVMVPTRPFASACQGATYLIVDIEGAEVDLLRGELPGIRAICVEVHPGVTGLRPISDMLVSLFRQGFVLDVEGSRAPVLHLVRDSNMLAVS